MATFVLVHGAWHGGWCWHKVVARLERLGHRVRAPDLVALGRDRTPVQGVSLAQWVDQVAALVQAQAEPVVLVGHSRAGAIVSEVAERLPERVARLVYLAAFMLRDGQTINEVARSDTQTILGRGIRFDAATTSMTVDDAIIRDCFYGGCSDDDVALARALLSPEPGASMRTPIHVTPERFGRVPRTYVECLRDRAVGIDCQRAMQAALPGTLTLSLDTDHSPFLSAPDALCALLVGMVVSP